MSTPVSNTSSLVELQKMFPNAIQIGTRDLATALSISPKTIANLGDAFAIKSVRFGRNKFYRLVDVALYIDRSLGLFDQSVAEECQHAAPQKSGKEDFAQHPEKRSRGRPPKGKAPPKKVRT